MIAANFFNLWIGQIGLRIWVKVISAPQSFIYVSAIILRIVGVSMAAGGLFSVTIMLFALLDTSRPATGFPLSSPLLRFLGPRFEISVAQSTSLMSGDWTRIVEYPIAIALSCSRSSHYSSSYLVQPDAPPRIKPMLWSLVALSTLSDSLLIKGEHRTANPIAEGFKRAHPYMVPSIWYPAVLGICMTALLISSTTIICGSDIIMGRAGNGRSARNKINKEPIS